MVVYANPFKQVMPAKEPQVAYQPEADGAPIIFTVDAYLVRRATMPKKGQDWKDGADQWSVRVLVECNGSQRGYAEFEWYSGVGLRAFPRNKPAHNTVAFYEESRPIKPSAKDFLPPIGHALRTALDMPRDDEAAMDYLESEFGHEGKASALLAMVRDLRTTHDKVAKMLAQSGLSVEDFTQWAEGLDA